MLENDVPSDFLFFNFSEFQHFFLEFIYFLENEVPSDFYFF
jgi:hypothetical protein